MKHKPSEFSIFDFRFSILRGAGRVGPKLWVVALWAAIPLAGQTPAGDQADAKLIAPPAEAPAKTVRVTAEGYDRDDAIRQALRRALEDGAGVQIGAFSQTENFALIRDTIYSRAFGVVKNYRILAERPSADGAVSVDLEATIRPDAVAREWAEVQNVLDQIGRPRIAVLIDETIDGQPQRESVVAARLLEMFKAAGFDLVDQRGIDELLQQAPDAAAIRQDEARLARLADQAGADLLIRGTANANRAGLQQIYGVGVAFYTCDASARVYYTDTARLLASESVPIQRSGARSTRDFSPQAARLALADATFPLRPRLGSAPPLSARLYRAVMEQWATQITAGGDIDLAIEPIALPRFLELKRALQGIGGVKSVDGEFTNGVGLLRIKALIRADVLAEVLTAKPFADWLEIRELKQNRIAARAR